MHRETIELLLTEYGVDAWDVAANDPVLPLAPPLPFAISLMIFLSPE